MKQQKIHYAWKILIAMCFIKSASMCFVTTINGIFIAPVCGELLVSRAIFTTPQFLMSAAALITMPFANRLYEKGNFRLLMTLTGAVYALCPFVLSLAKSISVWYIVSVFQGAASGILCTAAVPIILSNWFSDRYATALGISGAVGSALSMLANPVGNAIIAAFGWRTMYQVCGIGIAAMVIPFTAFVLRLQPSDLGLMPYGTPKTGEESVKSAPKNWPRNTVFGMIGTILLMTALMNLATGAVPLFVDFAVTEGYSPELGSLLVSMGFAGAMAAKLLIGSIIRRYGSIRAELLLTLISGVGFLAFLWTGGASLLIAAFACGCFMTTTSVVVFDFMRGLLGSSLFNHWVPIVTVISQLTYSGSQTLFAALYDRAGSYRLMFLVCACACLISFLIMAAMNQFAKKNTPKDFPGIEKHNGNPD